jgi:hypothetical protein
VSLQSVHCDRGHALLLVGETFDSRGQVHVGLLRCPVCREDYMDMRGRNEQRVAACRRKAEQLNLLEAAATW